MSNSVNTRTSHDSDPLGDAVAGFFGLLLAAVVLDKIFEKPEPKRTISGHSEADFAEIIRLLEQQ